MRKHIITIPKEFNYLGEVTHYKLDGKEVKSKLKLYKGIFNKVYPNCGGTTLVLEDDKPTIVCSPRVAMLESKHLQMRKDDRFTTLLVMGSDMIDNETNELIYRKQTDKDIREYIANNRVPKILCTYDSLYKVMNYINKDFHIVVDEFQLMLFDSGMKSEIEMRLLELVKDYNTTFLSATPLDAETLSYLDDVFTNIQYYECKFENTDKFEKITINRIVTGNPIKAIEHIIKDWYIDKNYYTIDGIQSKEAVIFVNSVTNIIKIIKETKLSPDNVRIIVSNTEDNERKIRKNLGNDYKIGRVPTNKDGSGNKMITLCTSTVFCGLDFYSNNAAVFIISDTHNSNTTIDIEFELQQIVGRERLDNNPFKYFPILIYNKKDSEQISYDDIEIKTKATESELGYLNSITDDEIRQNRIKSVQLKMRTLNYDMDYISYDDKLDKFLFNKFYKLNEVYKLKQRQLCYDGLYIYNAIKKTKTLDYGERLDVPKDIAINIEKIIKDNEMSFTNCMKRYCDYKDGKGFILMIDDVLSKYPQIADYYNILGSDRIKALSYQESNLKRELINKSDNKTDNIIYKIRQYIDEDKLYTNAELKSLMQWIYEKYNILYKGKVKTAKATDLKLYGCDLITKNVRIDGKQVKRTQVIFI